MKNASHLAALLWRLPAAASLAATADDPSVASSLDPNGVLPGGFPRFIITQNGENAPGVLMGNVNSTIACVGSYFLIAPQLPNGNTLGYWAVGYLPKIIEVRPTAPGPSR